MPRRFLLSGLVVGCLLAPASPADASAGWSDYYGDAGRVTVSPDRTRVTVCDLNARDDVEFKANYATHNPIDPRIYTVRAPQGGCDSGRSFISWITVFKLCYRQNGFGGWDCNKPVWIKPRGR
ncbi:hypothetical protein [Microbispora sp. ATCC PTA-5024]|uniref:hypothetical protein n=1 Tax=Microbispora sp. ATCC PTA-5024 TaxID=316330 RepID=UPI0012ECD158|nr:hypothetical protein [Microbispora sp. ATCC PTA-5024]